MFTPRFHVADWSCASPAEMAEANSACLSLWNAAVAASRKAYAPYSNFHVGSALITASGKIYSGCNVECVDYNGTHGEENAIGHMCMGAAESVGKKHSDDLVIRFILSLGRRDSRDADPVLASSCGKCRQKIREFSSSLTRVAVARPTGYGSYYGLFVPITELLPDSFGPEFVG